MVAAGVCATDAHFVWGWPTDLALDFEGLPVVLGHEGAGVVESVGAGVTAVSAGDKVVLMWMPECGVCDLCRNPKTNFCSVGNFYTTLYHDNRETRMKVNGKPLLSLGSYSRLENSV
jgi:S-(hydroxymethyl)glutathione dehydrogenase/alcohol dehydrogenase